MSRQASGQPERHNKLAEMKCNYGAWCVMLETEDWIQYSKRAVKHNIYGKNVQLMLPVRIELTTSGL
jgi:hypothetical protein